MRRCALFVCALLCWGCGAFAPDGPEVAKERVSPSIAEQKPPPSVSRSKRPATQRIAEQKSPPSVSRSKRPATQRIAVLEMRNLAMLGKGEIRYLSNLLRQAAGRLPQSKFLVMTNDSMEALLPPDVDLEKCEGTCPVEIGRTIQAHW